MDVKDNNFISVDDDIKQIAQDLLEENKTSQVTSVLYFRDKSANEPCVEYRRFESIPQMQRLGYIAILSESKNTQPRALYKYDTDLLEHPAYKVKIRQKKIEEYLTQLGILITTNPPEYENCKLVFMGKTINIRGSDQKMVCEALFKNKKSMNRLWSWDEVFEVVGETHIEKSMWQKVYNAQIKLNDKIGRETGVYDLLLSPDTKSIRVNQRYFSMV